ncbi:putative short-chain dehydrogenase [Xylariales sp. PMI_506]|nr:putative short-chain dehydrogenase [Xylariales sp. PMI_506]
MFDAFNPYADLFAVPKGPGDQRPTALQVVRDNKLVGQWSGKTVLVTGGSSGLGTETARALHATGADVYITARDTKKGQSTVDEILKSSEGRGKLEVIEMDMNSLDSVKLAVQSFLAKSSELNILINNAGVMAVPELTKTADGFEEQFGVNHLAHYTLTALLLPTLLKSSTSVFNSRIVNVTSSGHRYSPVRLDDANFEADGSYDPWMAYGQSKTANIWLANQVERLYGSRGVHANSVHPGGSFTPLHKNTPADLAAAWTRDPAMMASLFAPDQGAATSVWAATSAAWEGAAAGKYLCNCTVGSPALDMMSLLDPGFAPHAFDPAAEERLWELSEKLTGVSVVEA